MKQLFGAVASVLFLSGCEAGFSGAPRDSITTDRNFSEIIINGTLDKSRLEQLARLSFVDMNTRNAIIEARMAEIDVLYFEYENNISAEVRRGNFLTSMAGILVGAVGAQVSGGTSQQLSALSGVIAGGSSAYQKEVLLDRSVQAFVSQMRANRNEKRQRSSQSWTNRGQPIPFRPRFPILRNTSRLALWPPRFPGLLKKRRPTSARAAGIWSSRRLDQLIAGRRSTGNLSALPRRVGA